MSFRTLIEIFFPASVAPAISDWLIWGVPIVLGIGLLTMFRDFARHNLGLCIFGAVVLYFACIYGEANTQYKDNTENLVKGDAIWYNLIKLGAHNHDEAESGQISWEEYYYRRAILQQGVDLVCEGAMPASAFNNEASTFLNTYADREERIRTLPTANNVNSDMAAMTLDAAFAARWLAGVPDWNDMLQSLEGTAAGQPINTAVKERVALFRRVFGVDISELEQIPFSDGDIRIKFDAALLLLARQGTAPEHLLRASIRILVYIETNPLRSAVGHHMAAAMTKIWLKVCEHQSALLLTPAISIPALRTVCGSDLKGLQKTAAIILEAVPAVGMRLEQNVIDVLRRLAARQTIV